MSTRVIASRKFLETKSNLVRVKINSAYGTHLHN